MEWSAALSAAGSIRSSQQLCPLLALSGHAWVHCTCRLLGVKRTSLLRCTCLLMTQSGHSKCYYYYRAGRNLRLSLASSISSTKMKSRPLLRFAICVVITSGITAWSSFCDARSQVPGHNVQPLRHGRHVFRKDLHPERIVHPLRHGLHVFRKGVHLPSLHSSYPCSVLGHRPCIPYGTYCSIFSHHPCLPDINYPIGQTLQLTIVSRAEGDKSGAPGEIPPIIRRTT